MVTSTPSARTGSAGDAWFRTPAYHRLAWLEVTYAEYQARCRCRKFFRTWPLDVPTKADYDANVRQAVLDRLLRDRLNVEQTKAAMPRDFLVALSDGFVYDCLRWQLARRSGSGRPRDEAAGRAFTTAAESRGHEIGGLRAVGMSEKCPPRPGTPGRGVGGEGLGEAIREGPSAPRVAQAHACWKGFERITTM
ncbi:MAG TPA: hypothetical protein VKA46_14235 [Gemmataceae bacterium]|nr:hypothetical protein [Gemmataceae bacterium]